MWPRRCRRRRAAWPAWRRTPAGDRIQPLFRLKALLDANFREIAKLVTQECGKTLAEAEGEMRRGIENVEVACGIPSLMMGSNLEDIASGIDELMIRQPVGVVGVITPFNFPGMIPLWFLPYALACGNTRHPQAVGEDAADDGAECFELLEQARLPAGRRQPGARRQGRRGRPARPSGGARDLLRRLDAGRALRLQPRRGQRQARAVPGRRQESGRRAARRRHGDDDAASSPTRRSAAPASAASPLGRRSPWATAREAVHASRSATRPRRARSATAWTRASRWGRSSRPRAERASKA